MPQSQDSQSSANPIVKDQTENSKTNSYYNNGPFNQNNQIEHETATGR